MSSEKRHYLVEQQEEGQSNKSTDANNEGQSRKFTAKRGRFFFKKKPENAEEATTSLEQQQLQADIDAEREIALEHCLHEIIIKDMCGNCGKDLRVRGGFSGERMEPTVANVSMIHHVPELIVSNEIANKLGARDHENILNHRKLILLVDLDQTLVHTSNRPPKPSEVGTMDMFGYRLLGNTFFTKIRPHTRHFLERINKLYEMHIVTFGQRMYAHKIAELLDPNKKYFDYRVLSRDELLSSTHKTVNLKALFPCSEQLIVMLDDRPDVWMHSEALIRVKPYRFFVEVGDINAPPQDLPSKMEVPTVDTQNPTKNKEETEQNKKEEEEKPSIDQQSKNGINEEVEADNERTRTERPDNSTENAVTHDESDSVANCERNGHGSGSPDGQEQPTTASPPPQAAVDELSQPVSPVADDDNALEHIERILIRVHSLFYQQYDRDNKQVPDMKRIVGWLRSQVLTGECIVFSGLVPLGVDIRACEIYRLCTQFGAKVDDKIVEGQTTVLVAAKAATEKSVQAERLGIPIVSTRWLEACFDRWQKVDKTDFLFCNED